MSAVAKAIKSFCMPRAQIWVNGLGTATGKTLECPAWPCSGILELPTKKEFKHGKECPLSLLRHVGDGEELHKRLALTAHELDYEGGGRSSCPICKGGTAFRGYTPRHYKNCPGGIAHRTAPDEWFVAAHQRDKR